MKLKAVFFDLDGTLLDTLQDIRFVLNKTLARYGYPEITTGQAREYIGEGARRLVERALPQGVPLSEQFFAEYAKDYAHCANTLTKPFDGIPELLKGLQAAGVKIGILTNKPKAATEECVKQFFAEIPFDYVGGDDGLFPCKPDPSRALYAALSLRLSPAECGFVGDGETDVLTALNAGMFGVSVLWGYRSEEELKAAGATRFASTVEELGKILQNP